MIDIFGTRPHSGSPQRNIKPQVRQGREYQAVVPPLSQVKPKPAGEPSAEDRVRGGTPAPSAEAVLASVAGPEKAAADALPMDAKMDPNESIGGFTCQLYQTCLHMIQAKPAPYHLLKSSVQLPYLYMTWCSNL